MRGAAGALDCPRRIGRIRDVSAQAHGTAGKAGLNLLLLASLALFATAIGVRAVRPARVVRPEDVPEARMGIPKPMQFLGRGAGLRVAELDEWIAPQRRPLFSAARKVMFAIEDCPPLMDWSAASDGQKVERLLIDLRGGSREEAFAGLVLTLRIARGMRWSPGFLGRTQHAVRLGGLLQEWLRVWGDRSAKDPLLAEPALAASLVYGHVMRTAWRAPVVGYNRAPYERATAFLAELTGVPDGRRTDFGEALAARYAGAAAKLMSTDD